MRYFIINLLFIICFFAPKNVVGAENNVVVKNIKIVNTKNFTSTFGNNSFEDIFFINLYSEDDTDEEEHKNDKVQQSAINDQLFFYNFYKNNFSGTYKINNYTLTNQKFINSLYIVYSVFRI